MIICLIYQRHNTVRNYFMKVIIFLFSYWALAGHKRRIPLAVVLPPPARGPGTLIPSAQRLVWAAKQPLGKAALGALFA